MKNVIIAILVAVVIIFAFLLFTQKKTDVNYEPWPETEPATVKPTKNNTTNNYPVSNNPTTQNSVTKTYKGNGFTIDYPADMTVSEEDAEGGPYRMVYFSRGSISISYVKNSSWFEQYDLAELEYVGSQIINGNTFKIYQGNEHSRMWLKTGNTGYVLNISGFGDGDGLPGIDINTFNLI